MGNGKYETLGKLNIITYEPLERKVTLVPVNEENTKFNKQSVEDDLNKIYSKIGIKWIVNVDTLFNYTPKNGSTFNVTGSGMLSMLTDDMKAINEAFKQSGQYQEDGLYLFVIPNQPSDKNELANVGGDMPLGSQFGYLFPGAGDQTIAHEVGHGAFKLEHPFDRPGRNSFPKDSLNDNLMEYLGGKEFAKLQWDATRAPGHIFGIFQTDKSGMFAGAFVLSPDYKLIFVKNSTVIYKVPNSKADDCILPGFVIYETDEKTKDKKENFYSWDDQTKQYLHEVTKKPYDGVNIIEKEKSLGGNDFIYLFYNLDKPCGGAGYVTTKDWHKLKSIIEIVDETERKQKIAQLLLDLSSNEGGTSIPCDKANNNTVPWTQAIKPIYDCYNGDVYELFKTEIDAINNGVKADMSAAELNKLLELYLYDKECVYAHINIKTRLTILEILLKDGVDDQYWEFSGKKGVGDYFFLDNLILKTPKEDRLLLLNEGFLSTYKNEEGKSVKNLWFRSLWKETKNAFWDNDVCLDQLGEMLSQLMSWCVEYDNELTIDKSYDEFQITDAESIKIPIGFEPLLLGKGLDSYVWKSTITTETETDQVITETVENRLISNTISFELINDTYKVRIRQSREQIIINNDKLIRSFPKNIPYDKLFDPLEPVTLWIGHNYAFLGFKGDDKDQKIVVPALLAATLIQQIENDETVYYIRMGGNALAIVAAAAAAPYTGGYSFAAYAATLSVAGGVVASADIVLQTYKQELKKDGDNLKNYQEAFEAWDNLYTAVMVVDGTANISLAVKNFRVARALVRYRQAVRAISNIDKSKYAQYFRQLLNDIRLISTSKNINNVDDLLDINHLKALLAQTPTGNSLTRISKNLFDKFGLSISKPMQGRITTLLDDIMKNGDKLGNKTEEIIDILMDAKGYQKIDAKYHGVNGFDGCYIPKGQQLENATEIIITESKQFKQGFLDEFDDIAKTSYDKTSGLVLNSGNFNTGLPSQMSDNWIGYVIDKMVVSSNIETRNIGNILFNLKMNKPQIFTKYVNAVDKSTGEIMFLKLDNF